MAAMAGWQQKVRDGVDRLAAAVSPRWAYNRRAYRFAYDALDRSRTRTPRGSLTGAGDTHLTEPSLSRLREICRDHGRNNPIVKGLLLTEAIGVVGSETRVEARTADEGWNTEAERLWKVEMVDQPCEVTGRFNFHGLLNLAFLSYRRDGDDFLVLDAFGGPNLWLVEGEQCGTPYEFKGLQYSNVTNGVATEATTGAVVGYYIGRPNKWGYIAGEGYSAYEAARVHHVFCPDRISYTRGEPILTSAIDWIDKLTRYADAELVAAHVNALFVMALTKRFPEGILPTARPTAASAQTSEEGFKQEKMGPGLIYECAPGEDAKAIAAAHPHGDFDPFILRCLSFICRPLCMPLMLATLDYSGATFMNARIAYQEAHQGWINQQNLVVKPLVSRLWQWKLAQWIAAGKLSERADAASHEVVCKRWPYIDPYKEAMSDQLDMENGTTSRTRICARAGFEYRDIVRERKREQEIEAQEGLPPAETSSNDGGSSNATDKE